jgi:tetratricopeptide (TPR) repeat protein
MKNSIVQVCDRIITATLILLALTLPPAVWFPGFTMLYIKTTLLQCGAAILFASWIIRSLELRSMGLEKPVGHAILPAFWFFLSALISVTFVTPSFDTSFEIFCTRLPYFMLFLVTALSFSDMQRVRGVFVALMVSSFVVSVYGMMQHFGIDPFKIGDSQRIQSTFGNPNFYVGYLTLAIPAIGASFDLADATVRKKVVPVLAMVLISSVIYYLCYLTVQSLAIRTVVFGTFLCSIVVLCVIRQIGIHSFSMITLFLLINNLFLTGSRSALIGLGSAIIIFLILLFVFIFRGLSLRKTAFLTLVSMILAGAVVGGVIYISRSDEGRLKVVSERKYYVKGVLELVKRKPVFGNGIGTFKNNYPLVKSTASWAYNAQCFEFVSNVYNEHLEILHDEGVIGALIWAWFIVAIILLAIMAIRSLTRMRPPPSGNIQKKESLLLSLYSPSPQMLLVSLVSGVIAILIGNFFSLSMRLTATGFVFWLYCGIIVALASSVLKCPATDTSEVNRQKHAPRLIKNGFTIRAVQAFTVGLAIAGIVFSCRFFLADVYTNEAVCYSKDAYAPVDTSGQVYHDTFIEGTRYKSNPELWEQAIRYYRKAFDCNPFYLPVRYFFGNAFNRRWNMTRQYNEGWGDRNGVSRTDADRALEQYSYLIKQAPHTFEIDYELGDLYSKTGNLDHAINSYNDYKKYKPFFTKIHHALAEAYLAERDWKNAAEALKDALDLNQRFTLGYIQLSAVYHKINKNDLAEEMLNKAREISPKKADLALSDFWRSLHEDSLAEQSCRTAISRDSTNADAYFNLGWLYIENKQWKDAITAYEKVTQFDSSKTLAYINLSNLYYQEGRIEDAKSAYNKAYSLDPEQVQSFGNGQSNRGN